MNELLALIGAVEARENALKSETEHPSSPRTTEIRRAVLLRLKELKAYLSVRPDNPEVVLQGIRAALVRWLNTSAVDVNFAPAYAALVQACHDLQPSPGAQGGSIIAESKNGLTILQSTISDGSAPRTLAWSAVRRYVFTLEVPNLAIDAEVVWTIVPDSGVEFSALQLFGVEDAISGARAWRTRGKRISAMLSHRGEWSGKLKAHVLKSNQPPLECDLKISASSNIRIVRHPIQGSNAIRVGINVAGSALTAIPLLHTILEDPPGYMVYFAMILIPFAWERVAAYAPETLSSATDLAARIETWVRTRKLPRFSVRS
jgi:hypothetical protein